MGNRVAAEKKVIPYAKFESIDLTRQGWVDWTISSIFRRTFHLYLNFRRLIYDCAKWQVKINKQTNKHMFIILFEWVCNKFCFFWFWLSKWFSFHFYLVVWRCFAAWLRLLGLDQGGNSQYWSIVEFGSCLTGLFRNSNLFRSTYGVLSFKSGSG